MNKDDIWHMIIRGFITLNPEEQKNLVNLLAEIHEKTSCREEDNGN